MIADVQEFVSERSEVLVDQVKKLRENSAETVKEAITGSADTLKGLKAPVRAIARSGVKLTVVSQEARQNMIELVSDMIQAALTEAALRLERATKADNLVELVREQIELTPATRDRIVEDANRAVSIVKGAGRDIRAVAKHTYESLTAKEKVAEAAKPIRRKPAAKRAARKAPARKAAA